VIISIFDDKRLFFYPQTLFSAIVLGISLIITLASIVIWQRYARAPPAKPVPPNKSINFAMDDTADVSDSSGTAEDGVRSRINGSPQNSPSKQERNYQSCATSLNCAASEWSFYVSY
jgi:hypothetical protein